MLKNTKLSEIKRVSIPIAEPKCGDDLSKAMAHANEDEAFLQEEIAEGKRSGPTSVIQSAGARGGHSGMHESLDGGKDGVITIHTEQHDDSVTDSDMDEVIKGSSLNRKVRNVMHRVNRDWDNKITAELTKTTDLGDVPKSGTGKRR